MHVYHLGANLNIDLIVIYFQCSYYGPWNEKERVRLDISVPYFLKEICII